MLLSSVSLYKEYLGVYSGVSTFTNGFYAILWNAGFRYVKAEL